MQINISNEEIKVAIIKWVLNKGIGTNGEAIDVELVSGRGTKGITGSVEISEAIKAPDGILTRGSSMSETIAGANHATAAAAAPLFAQPTSDGTGEVPEAE